MSLRNVPRLEPSFFFFVPLGRRGRQLSGCHDHLKSNVILDELFVYLDTRNVTYVNIFYRALCNFSWAKSGLIDVTFDALHTLLQY